MFRFCFCCWLPACRKPACRLVDEAKPAFFTPLREVSRHSGASIRGTLRNAKGALRPLSVLFFGVDQMRIGITTYLKSSFSGIVINALELASPTLTCNISTFRFASTSSKYVTLNPMSIVSPW